MFSSLYVGEMSEAVLTVKTEERAAVKDATMPERMGDRRREELEEQSCGLSLRGCERALVGSKHG